MYFIDRFVTRPLIALSQAVTDSQSVFLFLHIRIYHLLVLESDIETVVGNFQIPDNFITLYSIQISRFSFPNPQTPASCACGSSCSPIRFSLSDRPDIISRHFFFSAARRRYGRNYCRIPVRASAETARQNICLIVIIVLLITAN